MSASEVIVAFNRADSRASYLKAERAAERLPPQQQLDVIDALRAARVRLGITFRRRDINTGCWM